MGSDDCKACREYEQLTRRNFVGLSAGLVAVAAAPSWLPRVVYAESENGSRDVIVSVFLRGGADALTLCPPYGDAAYYTLRPNLAVQPPDASGNSKALDLDGYFGVAPAMRPLLEAYGQGDLLVVHACGLAENTRSHFEAMHSVEVGMGDPPASLYSGWLGRHLQLTAPTVAGGLVRAIGIGAGLQRTLVGGPLTVPVQDPGDFGFEGSGVSRADRQAAVEDMYAAAGNPLRTSAESTFRTIDLLKSIDFSGYSPKGGARYAEDEFGYALESTAALIKAEVGVEAVAIDLGGWDTHQQQGPIEGFMAGLMASLAEGLAAFHQDMSGSGIDNVVVVVMSEFGRNAFENGSAGTDHGHGGLMLALGSGINGGRVLTEWPGLEPERLYEGQDLDVAVDYRDVLAEILEQRLGNSRIKDVFSDSGYHRKVLGVTL